MLYLRKQCDNTFAFRVNVAKIKEDGNFFPNNPQIRNYAPI